MEKLEIKINKFLTAISFILSMYFIFNIMFVYENPQVSLIAVYLVMVLMFNFFYLLRLIDRDEEKIQHKQHKVLKDKELRMKE
nr:MAG TPA: hypothetical protein [Caudoviricetes sp.]